MILRFFKWNWSRCQLQLKVRCSKLMLVLFRIRPFTLYVHAPLPPASLKITISLATTPWSLWMVDHDQQHLEVVWVEVEQIGVAVDDADCGFRVCRMRVSYSAHMAMLQLKDFPNFSSICNLAILIYTTFPTYLPTYLPTYQSKVLFFVHTPFFHKLIAPNLILF